MVNETKSKIGILQYIASSGAKGVKFEDQPETWYNPTKEAKDQVKSEYKGKRVEIMMAAGEKTKFTSMVLLDTQKESIKEGIQSEPEIEVEEVILNKITEPEKEEPKAKKEQPEEVPTETKEGVKIKDTGRIGDLIYSQEDAFDSGEAIKRMFMEPEVSPEYTPEAYSQMEKKKLETTTKGPNKLTYASWAEAWGALKRLHPTSTFKVHENKEGMPYFADNLSNMGAFVKVSVTVMGLMHTVHLPIMNNYNKSMKKAEITTFDINKNIMRCLAKAIAMHGIGLYVFKGEDLPEEK